MSELLKNTTQKDWLAGMGITPETYSGYDDATKLAIGDSYRNVGLSSTGNPALEYSNADGLFGLTNGAWNNMGQAAELLGTGYGLYDSILGNKSKLFKEQMGMLKDQRAQNKKMIADRETYKQNIGSGLANAFASKPAVI